MVWNTKDIHWAGLLQMETPCWWERIVGADRKAVVSQKTTLYNCGEQQSISTWTTCQTVSWTVYNSRIHHHVPLLSARNWNMQQQDLRLKNRTWSDDSQILLKYEWTQPNGVRNQPINHGWPCSSLYGHNSASSNEYHKLDNAPCHIVKAVSNCFHEQDSETSELQWPAQLPDLNPIKHLWDMIEQRWAALICSLQICRNDVKQNLKENFQHHAESMS